MRPENIRFDHAAPVWIEGLGPIGSDAISPVIFVGKASARIADVRNLDRSERADHIAANASRIRDRGIAPDPYATINAVTEMLGKLTENIAVYSRSGFGWINDQLDPLRSRKADKQG